VLFRVYINCYQSLSRVAICGGTHGNELSGVWIVREMQKQQVEKVGSISITTVMSNPRAVEACKRYMETDLNRCFTDAILSAPVTDVTPYEVRRAHELNAQLGPKGSQEAMDLVCDLHNTTANMGLYVPLSDAHSLDSLETFMWNYFSVPEFVSELFLLFSTAFEVGPQPNGVVRADIYNLMKEALDHLVDWVQEFNSGTQTTSYYIFNIINTLYGQKNWDTFTLHLQEIFWHPIDKDFILLKPGDPIFLSFSGETVKYEGKELYPFFVNECAYYEKHIAFHLAQKTILTIPSVRKKAIKTYLALCEKVIK
uniref:N-acyl-aromatic-L-amino acid amidohydrolase n=1 Tax=Myripristis murdjan TaxID=586833 RepID=A0A667Y2A1_9TELE